jgi:zinc protease
MRSIAPRGIGLGLILLFAATPAIAGEVETHTGFFPYPVQREVLPNGLHVLAIEMPEFKDVLSYNAMILAGARNEMVKGQSGLAHLFEHLMFRHMTGGDVNGYDTAIGELGAFNNAWTWFDVTFYHPVTFKSNMDELNALEKERFQDLQLTEKIFRTEAGAVLGEYRNNATSPYLRMSEVYLAALYGDYGYGHTAMGYYDDVVDMPNEYEAAKEFYDVYYRPNNTLFLASGDVRADEVFAMTREDWADWEAAEIPSAGEPGPVNGPKREHVSWATPVPPRIQVCYRMPPHRTGSVETAVGQILPELLSSPTAPLVQKLRSEKQVASSVTLGSAFYESFGPGPFILGAILYKARYDEEGEALIETTIDDMVSAITDLGEFSQREDADELLESLKSKYQYDLLSQINSPADAASTFSWWYRFEKDLDVFDKLVDSINALTPEDIDRFVQAVFVPENQVILTLTGPDSGAGTENGEASE